MKRVVFIVFFIALVLAGVFAIKERGVIFRENLPPAERGRRVAEREGCFTCHGPSGSGGIANPGSRDLTVPDFHDDVASHAKNANQIREWIRDGRPAGKPEGDGLLKMPAFGKELAKHDIEDLVAFVMAMGRVRTPDDELARRGLKRAEELGCFGCHGPGGRFAMPNPGSLKGYIPSWDGIDWPEMVRSKTEFGEWVDDGLSKRFAGSAFARMSIERATIKMPGYREHLAPGDIDALWSYVEWLRAQGE